MTSDIHLAQLLCSRLCHDLVGPAGAVNAGLELAEDGDLDGDALDLVTSSAAEITRRLAFFRIAFGAAGDGSHGGPARRCGACGNRAGGRGGAQAGSGGGP